MNQAIVIGPLALDAGVLVALVAIALGWFAASRAALRTDKLDAPWYAVLAAGLLTARAAYVLQHATGYTAAPLSMLDVRDGGWSPLAGFLGAAVAAGLLAARRRTLVKPLALGLATAGGLWIAANGLSLLLDARTTRLPALSLRALDGRPVALQQLQGKPLVVNLWATWCPPCIREMPVLQQAQRQRPDVRFVFVNQGESAERVGAFLAGRGLALDNVVLDARGELALAMGQRALPTTFFFDAQGKLSALRIGELSEGALGARLAAVAPAP